MSVYVYAAAASDRTELSCVNDDDYSYRQKNTFLNYQSRLTNAASCSWEIRKFTQGWTIYEPDGVTQRRGKVRTYTAATPGDTRPQTGHASLSLRVVPQGRNTPARYNRDWRSRHTYEAEHQP